MRILVAAAIAAILIFLATLGEATGNYTIPFLPRPLPFGLSINIIGWLLGLIIIVGSALTMHFVKNTELTPPAELVVVYGILGLLMSLIVAFQTAGPIINLQKGQLNLDGLGPVLNRFSDGLYSAGIAPIFAAILRIIESAHASSRSLPTTEQVGIAFNQLEKAIRSSSQAIETSSSQLAQSVTRIQIAAQGLDEALVGKGDRINNELSNMVSNMKGIVKALEDISRSSSTTSASLGELSSSALSSRELLANLEKLIEQVTNFVRAQK